ncbi:MAG: aldehyde dehydrogenase family protein [Steroidobacteraceae bacterium]
MLGDLQSWLDGLGLAEFSGAGIESRSPIDGSRLAALGADDPASLECTIADAAAAFRSWRTVPAPRRGELVRLLGEELRAAKEPLGRLVTLEAGKIPSEGAGEVQEMIDICDFAVGLSRQLYGLTIASERRRHHLIERWHPLGPVGVISAFNFPVAVWSWNAALALACGDSVVWKPSEKTPLTAVAVHLLARRALARFGTDAPAGLLGLVLGGREIGARLVDDARLPLISATGSTRMGREVGVRVAQRFGRSLLELGGNNATILTPSADLDLAVRAITFGAVGTAGQRCTTLRRLIVHRSRREEVLARLKSVYGRLKIGSPLQSGTLVGPLIDRAAFEAMQSVLAACRAAGRPVTGGERVTVPGCEGGYYVRPAIVELDAPIPQCAQETFAPILYVLPYDDFDAALELQNGVAQGLSSSILSRDLLETERFLSAEGSDCGIANVNMGTSGAEIGGAFGGEKETGGGRESGADAWRAYMRRQTQTVNYSTELPLAQGVSFDVD